MKEVLPNLLMVAGFGQLCVLIASALVPIRLRWWSELRFIPRLHRQLYWVYGGYVVLSIVAFGLISIFNSVELAAGSGLGRAFCFYVAVFWGIRLVLQAVLDVRDHLTTRWLRLGYHILTVLFAFFTVIYGWSVFLPAGRTGKLLSGR